VHVVARISCKNLTVSGVCGWRRLLELKDRPNALGLVVVSLDGCGRAGAVVAG
jgi:hypothetical protein